MDPSLSHSAGEMWSSFLPDAWRRTNTQLDCGLAPMAPTSALLLSLLRLFDDPVSYADYPAFRASAAGLATAKAIAPNPPSDAMGPRPGSESEA